MPPRKKIDGKALLDLLQRKDFKDLCLRGGLNPDETWRTIERLAEALEAPPPAPAAQPTLESRPSGRYSLVRVYSDGAARGNPGPAAAGAWWCDGNGNDIGELSRRLGSATNNVAEYEALRMALIELKPLSIDKLEILADSQLMVRQIQGQYRVKNSGLLPLYNEVMAHLERYRSWTAQHIPREENKRADALANAALDAQKRS